jgi:hypothetical protein
MPSAHVPTANINALYQNTTAGVTANPAVVDAAVADIVSTINQNADYVNSLVTSGTLSPIPPDFLYRQALINGNFDVWQRGTSFTSSGYTADRWVIADDGGTPSYTVTQESFTPGQTAVPGEPRYFTKISVSATSVGAIVFGQRIEDVRTFAGQKATLSFYARADVPTTGSQVTSAMFQVFGTGGSEQVGVLEYPIALTTSWQRYSFTFNIPSIAGKIIGQGSYLYVHPLRINPSAPLTNYYIAQVQLNAGDVALPFQPRSFAEELALCQRYYEKSYDIGDSPGAVNNFRGAEAYPTYQSGGTNRRVASFKVNKRVTPTITVYSPFTGAANKIFRTSSDIDALIAEIGQSSFTLYPAASYVAGDDIRFHWTADAEL